MWGRRKQVLGPLAACSPVFLARLNGRQRESRLQILLAQWPRTSHADAMPRDTLALSQFSSAQVDALLVVYAEGLQPLVGQGGSYITARHDNSPPCLKARVVSALCCCILGPGPLHLVLTSASFTYFAYQRPPHIAEIDRLTD
jgi:hypothetical protein